MATRARRSVRRRADRRRRANRCARRECDDHGAPRRAHRGPRACRCRRAAAEPGIGVLWARAKIEALTDARKGGEPEAEARNAIVEVALAHHLVSKYTSLVAVDVTPTAPPGTIRPQDRAADEPARGRVVRRDLRQRRRRRRRRPCTCCWASPRWCSPSSPGHPRRRCLSSREDADMQHHRRSGRIFLPSLAAKVRVRNWMRAAPPGIARRRSRDESSPVGGQRAARPRSARRRAEWIAATSPALGLALTGNALYIHAKALVAQALFIARGPRRRRRRAREAVALGGHRDRRPAPRARRSTPTFSCSPVRPGARWRSGPGHHDGSALPGEPGNAVFSAHRDTHFRFLRDIAVGDTLIVEMPAGQRFRYRVRATEVADQQRPAPAAAAGRNPR